MPRSSTLLWSAVLGVACALQPPAAHADCASGDGNLTTGGVCTTPQNLTGATGTIVAGAALSTGANATAYTVSSRLSSVTNAGNVSAAGPQAVLINGGTSASATLANSGSIIASQGTAIVVNPGEQLNLINTGDITGGNGTALQFTQSPVGPVSTITQAGGTIRGDIDLPGFSLAVLNITGGNIIGNINGGSAAGGNSGSSIFLGSTVNFDLGTTGIFTTNGGMAVGAANVLSGTLVLANNVVVNSFTNKATLQVNGARTLTGNFTQAASGTLAVSVSPDGSSQLLVVGGRDALGLGRRGNASLAGTLALAYQPGIYQPHRYTLLFADTSLTGGFSTVTGIVPTPGLTQSIVIDADSVDLLLTASAPAHDTIFSAAATALVQNGQRANSMLLDRWGGGQTGAAISPISARPDPPGALQTASAAGLQAVDAVAAALPAAIAPYGGWVSGSGSFSSVGGSAAAPGFTAQQGGFLAGIDRPVGDDAWLGGAAGYGHTDFAEAAAGNGAIETARVALYGGSRYGPAMLSLTTGYAYDRITTSRFLDGSGTARQGHDGHEATAAAQAALPLDLNGATVTPRAGLQFLHLHETAFTERGADGFNLSSSGVDTDSLQPYLSVSAARSFATDDGMRITPEFRLGYSREVLSNARQLTVALGGVNFLARGVRPSKDMLETRIGLTVQAGDALDLVAGYNATLPIGNTTIHTVSAGLRLRF